jgi:hypothetical protein
MKADNGDAFYLCEACTKESNEADTSDGDFAETFATWFWIIVFGASIYFWVKKR